MTNLQFWSLWYVKNRMFGPKCFGVARVVQNKKFIVVLIQNYLKIFQMMEFPFQFFLFL